MTAILLLTLFNLLTLLILLTTFTTVSTSAYHFRLGPSQRPLVTYLLPLHLQRPQRLRKPDSVPLKALAIMYHLADIPSSNLIVEHTDSASSEVEGRVRIKLNVDKKGRKSKHNC
ncbi:hypothetical protein BDZ91DRAFT_708770 [Kalaharituber pfeilii]|nr:hypothetical protein BDZ91DRAFT_708770 [Kalaharituber pfeilii]